MTAEGDRVFLESFDIQKLLWSQVVLVYRDAH